MKIKNIVKKILPNGLFSKIKAIRNSEKVETLKLNAVAKINLTPEALIQSSTIDVNDIIQNEQIELAWQSYVNPIDKLQIPDLTGGVNRGDRRAIFYIISHFKPSSVLEIGTHIGASTVHIATALHHNCKQQQLKAHFSTLDIRDVNDSIEKPWLKFKTNRSPKESLEALKLAIKPRFIHQNSIEYLESTTDTYDFIFLDGDHSAPTVYRELPKALAKLNKGGVILLHDYFAKGESANPKNDFNSGPYLAIQRYFREGATIDVLPFGDLPWQTKHGSNRTSLALLVKK